MIKIHGVLDLNPLISKEHLGYILVTMKRRPSMRLVILSFCAGILLFLMHRAALLMTFNFPPRFENEGERENFGLPKPSSPYQTIACDRTHPRSDICSVYAQTILHQNSSIFFVDSPNVPNSTEKLHPYPRKWEKDVIAAVNELTITTKTPKMPLNCEVEHEAPALVFSTGGYTGNLYHDFNDGIIPLFVTSLHLPEPPILVITNFHNWWLTKYADLLIHITPHQVLNLDNETRTHCFPSATFGLLIHGELLVDPALTPKQQSIYHFSRLLNESYTPHYYVPPPPKPSRPRLVLIVREGTRTILNQDEVVKTMEETGFDVELFKPTRTTELRKAYAVLNQSHAMVGVHGAALTQFLFMRPGSVFIQVVPLGTDWASEEYYGEPARRLGLDYLGYKITVGESSLVNKYERDDLILKDPRSVVKKGWFNTKNIYLERQDVNINVVRFRRYLSFAYVRAKRFMVHQG
ncbi:uncharacterized protein LOC18426991 isoform X1 [Amborella trichopoda]|nr:uncharacterized protein LOC18426991 isoform X2 [Amborella trichopoda]XP_020518432.1 uncharacterized protein LOC18426991 isoform X1 [Amborella trichopoda]|eukprot:XP_006836114.3 uncharacterized protein LOC18426991 isoform X2 [Amborella trichopoda]